MQPGLKSAIVVGASSDLGRRIVKRLCDRGIPVAATARNLSSLKSVDDRATRLQLDLEIESAARDVLSHAPWVVSVAHGSTVPVLLRSLGADVQRVIVIGSTRRFSQVEGGAAESIRAAEEAFLGSEIPGVMLHPTMIYGGEHEANISRVLDMIDRWPRWLPILLPVPGFGRSRIQPIHVDDVAASVDAALVSTHPLPRVLVIAGPEPITMKGLLKACSRARHRRFIAFPTPPLLFSLGIKLLNRILRGGARISHAEALRMSEDRSFDIGPMTELLSIKPRSLSVGLQQIVSEERGR